MALSLKRFLLIGFLLIFWSYFYGQHQNNPFEIKARLSAIDSSLMTSPIVAAKALRDTIQVDSLKNEVISTVKSKNPFEVNHVPLRKRTVNNIMLETANSTSGSIKTLIKSTTPSSRAFIFWITLATLLLLVVATTSSSGLLSKITKALLNENLLKLEYRNQKNTSLEYILLYVVFIINASIFIVLAFDYFGVMELSIKTFFKTLLGVTIIYILKHLSIVLAGIIFPIEKETSLYNFTIQIFNLFMGVIFVPVNIFLAFGPEKMAEITLYTTLGIIIILLIVRYIRGFTISINYFFRNIIAFFTYLCAMEIAPILVLVRFLQQFLWPQY